MMRRTSLVLLVLAALLGCAYAQSEPPMPKPAPELKNFEYFVGNWKMDAEMKASPWGPGGKMTGTEHCDWMEGKFFLVSHSDMKLANFSGTGLAVMGYDPDEKVYTYHEFNSMGEFTASKGNFADGTWTWTNDQKMGDKVFKVRFTIKEVPPKEYNFTYEMSPDGGEWMTLMDGKAVKQ